MHTLLLLGIHGPGEGIKAGLANVTILSNEFCGRRNKRIFSAQTGAFSETIYTFLNLRLIEIFFQSVTLP